MDNNNNRNRTPSPPSILSTPLTEVLPPPPSAATAPNTPARCTTTITNATTAAVPTFSYIGIHKIVRLLLLVKNTALFMNMTAMIMMILFSQCHITSKVLKR